MSMVRRGFLAGTLLIPAACAAKMQESGDEKRQRQLKEDWPWLGHYAADNEKLIASGRKVDIVFMGDSITQIWADSRPGFFTPGRIGRGIGGQTTPQMVLRMMADVIRLRPRLVHIMAGTNDVAANPGRYAAHGAVPTPRAVPARPGAHGCRVFQGGVPRGFCAPGRRGGTRADPTRLTTLSLQTYARRARATFIDYTGVLATETGAMKPGMAFDGVHPTAQGFAAMESVLAPVLKAHKA